MVIWLLFQKMPTIIKYLQTKYLQTLTSNSLKKTERKNLLGTVQNRVCCESIKTYRLSLTEGNEHQTIFISVFFMPETLIFFLLWTTRCLPVVCFSCKSFIVSLYIIKYWNEDLQHVYDSLLLFLKSFIFDWIPKKVPIIRIKKYSWVHCFRGCLLFTHTSHDINFRVGMMMMSEDAFLWLLFFMSPTFPAVNWPLHH